MKADMQATERKTLSEKASDDHIGNPKVAGEVSTNDPRKRNL
jgi:hypothetical protein